MYTYGSRPHLRRRSSGESGRIPVPGRYTVQCCYMAPSHGGNLYTKTTDHQVLITTCFRRLV